MDIIDLSSTAVI